MKRKLVMGIVAGFLMVSGMVSVSQAALVTLIDQNEVWEYSYLNSNQDLSQQWDSVGHDSFNWSGASWSTGQAAFGNVDQLGDTGSVIVSDKHSWWGYTDLALQKTFSVDGILNGPLTMYVASINGFKMFLNDTTEIVRHDAEESPHQIEFTFFIPPSSFLPGTNLLQILAEDHFNSAACFDMKLIGDVNPVTTPVDAVPEPATLLLLGTGLLGMIGLGRKSYLR